MQDIVCQPVVVGRYYQDRCTQTSTLAPMECRKRRFYKAFEDWEPVCLHTWFGCLEKKKESFRTACKTWDRIRNGE